MFTSGKRNKKQSRSGIVGLTVSALLCLILLPVPAVPKAAKSRSLYVTVESDGGLVRGLTQNNFRLFEDGKAKSFKLEEPESPASIALLLENSQSSYVYANDIQEVMQAFLDQAPEGNWYAFATYAHGLDIQVDFTKTLAKIRQAYDELPQPLWDETDTYDAVYEMLDKMSLLPGRKVLIVISFGYDSFSQHGLEDVQHKIESSDVTVFSVGLGTSYRGSYEPYLSDSGRMDMLLSQNFLKMLADESGGDSWFPNEPSAYYDIMKGIAQTLANQYRLVYSTEPIHDEKLHKIKVEAFQVINDHRKDFKVRVRKGWRL